MIKVILSNEFQMKLRKLACVMIHRSNHTLEVDDLIQIGQEAAIRAIKDYKADYVGENGPASPCTFFISRARVAMLNACNNGLDSRRLVDTSEDAQEEAANVGVSPTDTINNMQDLNLIFSRLTVQEVHVLLAYFVEQKTYEEIGADWKMSKQAVQKQQLSALQKIHSRLAILNRRDAA